VRRKPLHLSPVTSSPGADGDRSVAQADADAPLSTSPICTFRSQVLNPSKGRSDQGMQPVAFSPIAKLTPNLRPRGAIVARSKRAEVACEPLKLQLKQRSEAFLVRWPTGCEMKIC
jgi:hypothetical protein